MLTVAIPFLDLFPDRFEEFPSSLYFARGPDFLKYSKSAQCLRFCLLKPVLRVQDTSARKQRTSQGEHVVPRE